MTSLILHNLIHSVELLSAETHAINMAQTKHVRERKETLKALRTIGIVVFFLKCIYRLIVSFYMNVTEIM